MEKIIVYIHGKGGSPEEAAHYRPLFPDRDVLGFDYASRTPWEAVEEFSKFFDTVCRSYSSVELIANSIGALFAMHALGGQKIAKACFLSPIVDMEQLIFKMMSWENVTEEELRSRKEIPTQSGEVLSWYYLCYVREHPIRWNIPTHILYGEKDQLTAYETVSAFAERTNATLTVMKGGEHWFHTEEQMKFLDRWVQRYL